MPPIKGRMIGRMGAVASVQQSTKQIRNVQKTTIARRKYKSSPIKSSTLPDNIKEDRKLMAMRMPEDIVRILPSVKKYKGSKDFVDLTDTISVGSDCRSVSRSDSEADSASVTSNGNVIGLTHRGRGTNKYAMKQVAEERFLGIIFDVGISPTGDIIVCCCEGVFVCDTSLERKMKLDHVVLPGGVAFFDDGRIVIVCRNQDTINFFSKDGIFIKAFNGGFSPMSVVINSRNELIVSDPGTKCVRVFSTNGEELCKLQSPPGGCELRWPMYMGVLQNDHVVVCDCHAQSVIKFGANHKHKYTYKLKTACGNEVLRPHGIATNQNGDLFVIDTTMDTVEVFTPNDSFMQTLLTTEEGCRIKPKCMAVNQEGLVVIGGRLGMVRVYEFLKSSDLESKSDIVKTPMKQEIDSKTPQSKISSSKRSADKTPRKNDVSKVKRNVFKTEVKSEVFVEEDDHKSNSSDNKSDVIVLE